MWSPKVLTNKTKTINIVIITLIGTMPCFASMSSSFSGGAGGGDGDSSMSTIGDSVSEVFCCGWDSLPPKRNSKI